MRRQSRQAGFSIVEAVIAVVAIGVIGTAGFFVYQHNRLKLSNAAPSGNQQVTVPAATSQATTVVKIPELGIQITVSNPIKDLKYQANTTTLSNGNKATYALISTTALTAVDAKCDANSAALGSLETASGQYPSTDTYAALNYGPLLKQFSTFYVTYSAPQGGCSSTSSAQSAQNRDKATFQAALSTVQPLN